MMALAIRAVEFNVIIPFWILGVQYVPTNQIVKSLQLHYICAMVSQLSSNSADCSIVWSDSQQMKHQHFELLAFLRWNHR